MTKIKIGKHETVESTSLIQFQNNLSRCCVYFSKNYDSVRCCRYDREYVLTPFEIPHRAGTSHIVCWNRVFRLTDAGERRNELNCDKEIPRISQILNDDEEGSLLVLDERNSLNVLTKEGEFCSIDIEPRVRDQKKKLAFFIDEFLYILSEQFLLKCVNV